MFKKNPNQPKDRLFGRVSILTLGLGLFPMMIVAGADSDQRHDKTAQAGERSGTVSIEAQAYEAAHQSDDEGRQAEKRVKRPVQADQRDRWDRPEYRDRSYRDGHSEGSYGEWLDRNPRYSHPIHEMVHRNSWSEQVRRNQERASQARRSGEDPRDVDYEEPRVISPDDITYDPNDWDKFYPYPRSRVLYYNDRYYTGRYYHNNDQDRGRYSQHDSRDRMGSHETRRSTPRPMDRGYRGTAARDGSDRDFNRDENMKRKTPVNETDLRDREAVDSLDEAESQERESVQSPQETEAQNR